jgi:DNA-binding Lrp family transcriptional regulator
VHSSDLAAASRCDWRAAAANSSWCDHPSGGFGPTAWIGIGVRIRPTAGQLPKIAELAAATPEVTECHRISGEDRFLIQIPAGAIEDLETILDRFPRAAHSLPITG